MSSSCCGNCGCDPCLCENPYQPDVDNLKEGTPVIQITGEPDTSCVDPDEVCPVGPQCEEFTVPDPVSLGDPEAAPPLINVRVCDSSIYTVGMCVTIYATASTTSSNQAVLRVNSIPDARTVALEQYSNASDNAGAVLSDTMYICPMSHCLEETVAESEECHEFKVLTDADFTVPNAHPATSPLTLAECTDLEAGDRIHIRNDAGFVGGFDIDSIDVTGTDLVLTNPELAGSLAGGTVVTSGARVSFPTPFTLPEIPLVNPDTYVLGLSLSGVPEWVLKAVTTTTLDQSDITPMSTKEVYSDPASPQGVIVPPAGGVGMTVDPAIWTAPNTYFFVPDGYRTMKICTLGEDVIGTGPQQQLNVWFADDALGASGAAEHWAALRGELAIGNDDSDYFLVPVDADKRFYRCWMEDAGAPFGRITGVHLF